MAHIQFNKVTLALAATNLGYLAVPDVGAFAQLIEFINHDDRWESIEQIAYFLATVAHECARTWQPIEERGSDAYFNEHYGPDTEVGKRLGNVQAGDGLTFHGRGYVQLTGRTNYSKMSQFLTGMQITPADVAGVPYAVNAAYEKAGSGNINVTPTTFSDNPILVRVPSISYEIAVRGMLGGFFTGAELSKFVTDSSKTDFVNARRVINGLDRAEDIAKIATDFVGALNGSKIPDPVLETPVSGPSKPVAAPAPVAPTQSEGEISVNAVEGKFDEIYPRVEKAEEITEKASKWFPHIKKFAGGLITAICAIGSYAKANPEMFLIVVLALALIGVGIWLYRKHLKR